MFSRLNAEFIDDVAEDNAQTYFIDNLMLRVHRSDERLHLCMHH